uniref:Uncharacterized protein n=1 Tax=Glossina pallidipes TaxID=7398 RepID=A0A1A9ZCD4_GLOPL
MKAFLSSNFVYAVAKDEKLNTQHSKYDKWHRNPLECDVVDLRYSHLNFSSDTRVFRLKSYTIYSRTVTTIEYTSFRGGGSFKTATGTVTGIAGISRNYIAFID